MTGTERPARIVCRHCGAVCDPGEVLVVRPVDGTPAYYVCRPDLSSGCFQFVGSADRYRIAPLVAPTVTTGAPR